MKLLSITIQNFRSFKGKQTFEFPEAPGLYFMQGINEAEPRLEANGSGKSTIWDALVWCFRGQTSAGLKAGDVCNWDVDKGVRVALHFVAPSGEECVMTRTWKPNTWTLGWPHEHDHVEDLTKSKENPVLGWLALEPVPFMNSIVMAQGEPMFLDLKHDQQASLFSEVMGLDRWLDYSTRASKKASETDKSIRELERRQSELKGQVEGQQDFAGSIDEFETKRKARIKACEKPYLEALAKQKKRKAEQPKLFEQEDQARLKVFNAKKSAVNLRDDIMEATRILRDALRAVDRAEDQAKALEKQITFLDSHDACPTCHQDLGSLQLSLDGLEADWQAAKAVVNDLKARAKANDQERALVEDEARELENTIAGHNDDLAQAEGRVRENRQNLLMLERELDDLENEVEAIQAETNPFKKLQEEARNEARRRQNLLGEVTLRLNALNESYGLYSFWVRGFKDLRLQMIAEALTELEIEVNSCVAALGLVDWELRFQVDRETRGGSIQRGFSVQVLSPGGTKLAPWASWSGGERQRLRIAATMGLANLIRTRSGTSLDLEVWDEPSAALSPQGVQDLLGALERRAQVEGRCIWVVDHTAHTFGGFTGGATITKTAAGSLISQY